MRPFICAIWFAAAVVHADEPVDLDAPSLQLVAKKDGQIALVPKVLVGEPFHVVVTATARPDVLVNLPASFDTGSFEVLERSEGQSPDGRERSFDLIVVAWKTGAQTLPPIPMTYVPKGKGEVKRISTAGLDVEVVAILPDPTQGELAPIAAPVDVFVKDWTLVWVAVGAGAILVLLGVALVVRRMVRRRHRRVRAAAVVGDLRSPDEIALDRLAALEQSGALDHADRRPYYFAVTEIVRDYLGRRFAFDARDKTSSELMAALERSSAVHEVRVEVERWLGACDLVKYARVSVEHAEAARSLAEARALVQSTRPPPPEAARAQ